MICTHVELTMDTTEPRDVAKAMLKFWLYQAEQARQTHSSCLYRIAACEEANRNAVKDWRDNDDGCGFGFGPSVPFSESEIQKHKDNLPIFKQHLDEANAMAAYMVNYITDKVHQ